MKRIHLTAFLVLAAGFACAAPNVTNTVLMVDQRGQLNTDGVASVADVATNSVKATVAEAKAEAARKTARDVTNSVQGVAANIMSNNVVIYRSGFSDAFAPLVIFTDDDTLVIKEARWLEKTAAQIKVEIDYCCTADIGTVKPIVMHHNTLDNIQGREDFYELPASSVTTPTYTAGAVTIQGQQYSGYYTTTATIANPAGTTSYFLWIKVTGDTPGGAGATLDLPNGVTGGQSAVVVWGDKRLTFEGGVLKGVQDAN